MTVPEAAAFGVGEANQLLRAQVAQESRRLGIDAVILKGRALSVHGLGEESVSFDVDVLTTSEGASRLAAVMTDKGWLPRPWDDPDGIFPQHSSTYYHPHWPVDLDIHFRFPGCEAPTDRVVAALLADSVHVVEAGLPVPTTGLEGSVVIAWLNALRHPTDRRSIATLENLRQRVPTRIELAPIMSLAGHLGALAALAPALREAYPGEDLGEVPEPSRNWLTYSHHTESASIRIEHLLMVPMSSIPKVVMRALWPSRRALAASDLRVMEMSQRQLTAVRLQRIVRTGRRAGAIAGEIRCYLRSAERHGVVERRADER